MDNIYGKSPTPNETAVLIKDKLVEFESALDQVSDHEKKG